MHRIFIKCPNTGKLVNTGFAMDPPTFNLMPDEQTAIECPHCKSAHEWTKRDALFEKEDGGHQAGKKG